MHTFTKVGLDALLTPENCAVLLIDHQPSQLANVNSHEPTMVINNVTALAKTRTLADGVVLEFGASREANLALRSRITRVQPALGNCNPSSRLKARP
jgi:hypothetical protein